jgi:hypothetical protein
VRLCQRPSAKLGILHHGGWTEYLDQQFDLHVPELPNVEVPSSRPDAPAQEEVAGRLHKPVTVHDPLAMVTESALPCIKLQNRFAR